MIEKVCAIIPFRDRWKNLREFMPRMREYAPDVDLILIEQCDTKPWNKGALINAAFDMAPGYTHYIQHDIDLFPIDVDYSPAKKVVHMATEVEQFGYTMPYKTYFGGVVMFPKKQFMRLNGFSNNFWGYGGEDDEIRKEMRRLQIPFGSRAGRFNSLPHERGGSVSTQDQPYYKWNVNILNNGRPPNDGLNCVKYMLSFDNKMPFYRHIGVEILHNTPTQQQLSYVQQVSWKPETN